MCALAQLAASPCRYVDPQAWLCALLRELFSINFCFCSASKCHFRTLRLRRIRGGLRRHRFGAVHYVYRRRLGFRTAGNFGTFGDHCTKGFSDVYHWRKVCSPLPLKPPHYSLSFKFGIRDNTRLLGCIPSRRFGLRLMLLVMYLGYNWTYETCSKLSRMRVLNPYLCGTAGLHYRYKMACPRTSDIT
jgi:hypothetical protein